MPTVLNWNLEFHRPTSPKGRKTRARLLEVNAGVVCLTEAFSDSVPPDGQVILGAPNWGYDKTKANSHKVLLWSKTPWTKIEIIDQPTLPPGRFVSGITGGIRYVGVCVPWRMAHVSTGRRDASAWSEHLTYLKGLQEILAGYRAQPQPIVVLGDFNQRLPKTRWDGVDASALQVEILADFDVITSGLVCEEGKGIIDHVACRGVTGQVTRIMERGGGNCGLKPHLLILKGLQRWHSKFLFPMPSTRFIASKPAASTLP